jgi:catechol 2,3-dioxygenase
VRVMAKAAPSTSSAIDPRTTVGSVALTVSDLERSRQFYERVIGLRGIDREDGSLAIGGPGGAPLLTLHGDPSAKPVDHAATGLFHFAILMPTRAELARSLRRIAEARWPLSGASDHLVSEALYLSDPDGNGIEIYRDRPREQWPERDGSLQMATIPLDLDDVLSESAQSGEQPVPPETRMGHVHLQVSDLDDAERFYSGVLGFDVTVRGYPGALFVSAGGYHHHIGLNTWHSAGASPPQPGSIGLRSFEVLLPDRATFEQTVERARAAGIAGDTVNGGTLVRDPSGNGVLLTLA